MVYINSVCLKRVYVTNYWLINQPINQLINFRFGSWQYLGGCVQDEEVWWHVWGYDQVGLYMLSI